MMLETLSNIYLRRSLQHSSLHVSPLCPGECALRRVYFHLMGIANHIAHKEIWKCDFWSWNLY